MVSTLSALDCFSRAFSRPGARCAKTTSGSIKRLQDCTSPTRVNRKCGHTRSAADVSVTRLPLLLGASQIHGSSNTIVIEGRKEWRRSKASSSTLFQVARTSAGLKWRNVQSRQRHIGELDEPLERAGPDSVEAEVESKYRASKHTIAFERAIHRETRRCVHVMITRADVCYSDCCALTRSA